LNWLSSCLNDWSVIRWWWLFNYRWRFAWTTTLVLITISTCKIDYISIVRRSFTCMFVFIWWRGIYEEIVCFILRNNATMENLIHFTLSTNMSSGQKTSFHIWWTLLVLNGCRVFQPKLNMILFSSSHNYAHTICQLSSSDFFLLEISINSNNSYLFAGVVFGLYFDLQNRQSHKHQSQSLLE
jgi:hypothetical protein